MAGETVSRPDLGAWARRVVPGWVAWLPVLGSVAVLAGSAWFLLQQQNLGYVEGVADDNDLLRTFLPLMIGWFNELPWAALAAASLGLAVVLELVHVLGRALDNGLSGPPGPPANVDAARPVVGAVVGLLWAAFHLLPAGLRVTHSDEVKILSDQMTGGGVDVPWTGPLVLAAASGPFLVLAFLLWRIGRTRMAWIEAPEWSDQAGSAPAGDTEPPAAAAAAAGAAGSSVPVDPLSHLRPSTSLVNGLPGTNGDRPHHWEAPAYLPPGEASNGGLDASLFEPPRR